jgi:hypothetical protein
VIEVNAVFTKEKIKEMGKSKRISNLIFFPLLSAVLVAGGIISIVRSDGGNDLVFGIVMLVIAPLMTALCLWMTKSDLKNNIESFGVQDGDVIMNYKFAPQGIAIARTKNGKTEKEALSFGEIYMVKRTKTAFMMYINKEELFYIPTDSFVHGTPDELFKLFYDNKIILDYRG